MRSSWRTGCRAPALEHLVQPPPGLVRAGREVLGDEAQLLVEPDLRPDVLGPVDGLEDLLQDGEVVLARHDGLDPRADLEREGRIGDDDPIAVARGPADSRPASPSRRGL